MTRKKFEVGQTVLLTRGYGKREPEEVVISKVGRTLAYVQRNKWSEEAFYLADGCERRPANSGGVGDRIWTLEEWTDRQHRDDLTKALAEHGIGPKGYGHLKQSTKTLERILAILEEGSDG